MFNHGTLEAQLMRWLKSDIWKVGIGIAGILLLLALMVWLPVPAVSAQERAPELATPGTGTVQATPTIDATVTELNKEKLAQEVQQLKNQNAPDPLGWLQTNASIFLSTLVVVIGALFGFWQWGVGRRDAQNKELADRKAERERRDEEQQRWLKDQEAEREKRTEERFQAAVVGLGSKDVEARTGAAIMLRTFLQPGYEQFYQQSFDLAVAHLRLRHVDSKKPEPLDSLSQALITVFKESFSRTRRILEEQSTQLDPQSLDASHIQLDNAFLIQSDLERVWMREALLREARLYNAKLSGAHLRRADLREAYLNGADLTKANLTFANLSKARLRGVNLREADIRGADLSETELNGAELNGARFDRTNLSKADLSETDLEDALSLKDTNLSGVAGLTKEQLEACKAKGAIIDEVPATSASQSTVSPSSPSPSNDVQSPSTPSAQRNTPTSDTDTGGNSATPSSKPDQDSWQRLTFTEQEF
jgi:uncharacterized protein YjbI with pentapeptide repeats